VNVFLVSLGEYLKTAPSTPPPVGILSLAAWARAKIKGLRITLLDQRLERINHHEVARRIIQARPDVVGISYMTSADTFVPGITKAVRDALPGCTILLGGSHPAAVQAAAIEGTQADALVAGEGEIAFEMILRAIQEGETFEHVPGLYRRLPDGSVVRNPGELPIVQNLDELPFLAYDLLDVPRYWTVYSQSPIPPPQKQIVLSSSRGCPFPCIFCHKIFGKTFRGQTPERLVDEMEYLQKKYGAERFDFIDDAFIQDNERVYRFSEEVNRRNLRVKLTMPNGLRTDALTQEIVDAMVAAGLRSCACALDAGSPRIQKLVRKGLNIQRFLDGVEMMARHRVFTYGFMMFGFPTETAEEMQMTIDISRKSLLHMAFFFKATPYPNSGLYDLAMQLCPERMQNLDFTNHDVYYNPVVNLSAVSDEELLYYLRKATRVFFGNPVRLFRFTRDCPHPFRFLQFFPGAIQQSFSRKRGRFRHPVHYPEGPSGL